MDRKWFNICIIVFLVINDYLTWVFVSQGENPMAIIIGVQFVAWLIANAIYEANK